MDDGKRLLCRLVSVLLDYPDEKNLNAAAEAAGVVEEMPADAREKLGAFLAYLRKTPLLTLQEEYTRTFDLNPGVCLNLTYHKWGDDRKRGAALADLKNLYRDNGYEISGEELPDYLPMVLEFLSVCPENTQFPGPGLYVDQFPVIASRLREMQSPYTGLFEILDSVLRR
ncbi:nitrate reductase molybdenum cofactor assembly chaperone [Aminiphilus sp.]|uniref:nitrate reductase molybdenum cofactor assembly chaperone n=1 Tax=Aminiphilus sp. TaxID=1872488 RepID=UPI0026149473|nr:nitrate reductase molybdenum cofactor assembly chaperone [Aminiphilus sp.]